MKKFLNWLLTTKQGLLLLLLVLITPAFYFMLKPGIYWNMHDDMQMIRQLEFEKCLKDGQIPCRWTPDLGYGYGYPLFNFYPVFPYIVGQIFRTLTFSFVMTVKLTALLQIVLSALFMFLLGAELAGPLAGFMAALFYTYAPYHAVNVYVRGAMNEAWASVFFPLLLLFSFKFIKKPNLLSFILFALSYSGLLLSHNPMVLIFTPFLAIWSLFWIIKTKAYRQLAALILSGLLGIGLSAFFTLPVLFESQYVQIETMFQNYYHFTVHYVDLNQLFISNFWGDGPSVWGPNDGMSFSVGYLHWILPLLGLLFISYLFIRRQYKKIPDYLPFIFFTLSAFFTIFMTHQRSYFIWNLLPPIQKLQFPWRFLSLTNIFTSSAIIYLPLMLRHLRWPKWFTPALFSVIIVILLAVNIPHFYPVTSGPVTDTQKFSGRAWTNLITSGIYDYLPKTALTAAKAPAKDYIDDTTPTVKYTILGAKKGTDWIFFNLNLKADSNVTLAVLGFPGFKLYDFGKPIDYKIEPTLGRITTHLTAGNHQIYLKLYNTPIRNISDSISIFSWTILALLSVKLLWTRKQNLTT